MRTGPVVDTEMILNNKTALIICAGGDGGLGPGRKICNIMGMKSVDKRKCYCKHEAA